MNGLSSTLLQDFEMIEALSLKSDCWSLRHADKDIRFALGNYHIRLIGPGPETGHWIPAQSGFSDGIWEWMPVHFEKFLSFVPDDGVWKFYGRKPYFKAGAWVFTGSSPTLKFSARDGTEYRRFFVNSSKQLMMTRDSASSKLSAHILSLRSSEGGDGAMAQSLRREKVMQTSGRLQKIIQEEIQPLVGQKVVTDYVRIETYFREAVATNVSASVSSHGDKKWFSPKMYSLDQAKGCFKAVFFEKGFESVYPTGTSFYFVLDFKRARIQFVAKMIESGIAQFSFEIPQKIILIQRRGQYRLDLEEKITVEFSAPHRDSEGCIGSIGDISAGGLSLEFWTADPSAFGRGDWIKSLRFEWNFHEFEITGTVCHSRVVQEKDGLFQLRLGVQFRDDPQWDQASLQMMVSSLSRTALLRFYETIQISGSKSLE